MTASEMGEWIKNNHKEVLVYLRQEFDGDITEFEFINTPNSLGHRYYSHLRVKLSDGGHKSAEMVTELRGDRVAIERFRYNEPNLPQGF